MVLQIIKYKSSGFRCFLFLKSVFIQVNPCYLYYHNLSQDLDGTQSISNLSKFLTKYLYFKGYFVLN